MPHATRPRRAHPLIRRLTQDFIQGLVQVQLDDPLFNLVVQALDQNFFRAEFITAMNEMNFGSNICQIECFFDAVLPPPMTATFCLR